MKKIVFAGIVLIGLYLAWQRYGLVPGQVHSDATYALAYSSGRHFATTGNRLHLVYTDGAQMSNVRIWDFSTLDGRRWKRHLFPNPRQGHVVTSAWQKDGQLHVACVSRLGTVLAELSLWKRRALAKEESSWSFEAPSGSPEGIVFRRRLPGDNMRIMVRWPDGIIERITNDGEESQTAAGTSGQLHRIGRHRVVLWSGAKTLNASWLDRKGWKTEIVDDEFCGVHDVSAVVLGDKLWVAYLSQPAGFLTIRSWSEADGWSERQNVGTTEVHSICLWTDGQELYAVQVLQNPRRLQVLHWQPASWEPLGKPVAVPSGGYLWPCGTSFRGHQILAWTEAAKKGVTLKTAVVDTA